MPKNAVLRARVDEETLKRFDAIVEASVGDRSDHLRAAVQEYIAGHQAMMAFTDRLMAVANGETVNQV